MIDDPNPALPRGLLRLGVATWTVIGIGIVLTFTLAVLAAVSEIVMPLIFAVMIGAVAYPLAARLQRRGMRPAMAALAVVTGIILAGVAVVLIAVQAIGQQTAQLADNIDDALAEVAGSSSTTGLDVAALTDIRHAVSSMAGFIGRGLLTAVIGGVGAVVGLVGSVILSMLIMYYLLKDGPDIRTKLVRLLPDHLQEEATSFFSASVRSIRGYWTGRSMLSAVVTAVVVIASLAMGLPMIGAIAVVNFVGGFVPYIGAFIGGGLATLLALADGGIGEALVMLAIVLAANLLLENLLEPRIMSGRLKIHPLLVLIATTAGGVIGGIVGLILAVPVTVLTIDLFGRLRRIGALSAARSRVEPALRKAVSGENAQESA